MTVQDTTRRAGPYAGTGAQTSFPFTFKTFAAEDVRVVIEVADVESDVSPGSYTVTLNENQETTPGGSVVFFSAPATGTSLVILSDVAYDQPLALPSGGNFPPRSVEQQFDRVAMQLQQIREEQARALTLPATIPAAVLPVLPQPRGGQVLGWDEAGVGLTNRDASELVNVVAYGSTLITVANGGEASYTLPNKPGVLSNTLVFVNGVHQRPGVDYTIDGTTLTPTPVFPAGTNNVVIRTGQALPPQVMVFPNQDEGNPYALDWYYRGDFAPTLQIGGGSTGFTMSSQVGDATRVGDMVRFRVSLQMSAKTTASGSLIVRSLPYTVAEDTPVTLRINGVTAGRAGDTLQAYAVAGTTAVRLERIPAASGSSTPLVADDVSGTVMVQLSGSYRASSATATEPPAVVIPPTSWAVVDLSSTVVISPDTITDIDYLEGTGWVALLSNGGGVSTSTDGATWTAKANLGGTPGVVTCYDYACLPGKFVVSTGPALWGSTAMTGAGYAQLNGAGFPTGFPLELAVIDGVFWALQTDGTVWSSTAPLTSWTLRWTSPSGSTGRPYAISKMGTTMLVVGDNGAAARSTDNGATWSTITVSGLSDTNMRMVRNDGTRWLLFQNGRISQSTDGATWTSVINFSTPGQYYTGWLTSINQAEFTNGVWIITGTRSGSTAEVYYSVDNLATINRVVLPGTVALNTNRIAIQGGAVLVSTDRHVWRASLLG